MYSIAPNSVRHHESCSCVKISCIFETYSIYYKNPLHLTSTRTQFSFSFQCVHLFLKEQQEKNADWEEQGLAWYLQQDMHTRYKRIEFSFKGYLKKKTIQTLHSHKLLHYICIDNACRKQQC